MNGPLPNLDKKRDSNSSVGRISDCCLLIATDRLQIFGSQ
jgi:hypothetical protein